jgi:putative tricarboxylic transport membrane protein
VINAIQRWGQGRSEIGVALLLLGLGGVVLVDASNIRTTAAQIGPVGPKAAPVVVGLLLVVTAVMLAVDVLRGGRGTAEGGEDVDLTHPSDWRTVLLLAASFLVNAALIEHIGWPLSGALLFFGASYALGSRHYLRDALVSLALGLISYLLFARGLGVALPAGLLDGVL